MMDSWNISVLDENPLNGQDLNFDQAKESLLAIWNGFVYSEKSSITVEEIYLFNGDKEYNIAEVLIMESVRNNSVMEDLEEFFAYEYEEWVIRSKKDGIAVLGSEDMPWDEYREEVGFLNEIYQHASPDFMKDMLEIYEY